MVYSLVQSVWLQMAMNPMGDSLVPGNYFLPITISVAETLLES